MKKKLLALLLCLALSLSLSACGSSQTTGVMSQVTNTSGSNDDLPVVKWKMASTWGSGNVHFTVERCRMAPFSAPATGLVTGQARTPRLNCCLQL